MRIEIAGRPRGHWSGDAPPSTVEMLLESLNLPQDALVRVDGRYKDHNASLLPTSDILIRPRLLGGGGDGGSIPKRLDMIQTKGYTQKRSLGGMGYTPNTLVRTEDESMSMAEQRALKLSTCALTQAPLVPPVVVDGKGNLLSKEKLIEALLNRKAEDSHDLPPHLKHISALKAVKDIKKEHWRNCDRRNEDVAQSGVLGGSSMQVNRDSAVDGQRLWCPLKNTAIQGVVEGAFAWACGCVFSLSGWATLTNKTTEIVRNRVLKHMKGEAEKKEDEKCPVCSTPLSGSKYAPAVLLLGYEGEAVEKSSIWDLKKKRSKQKTDTTNDGISQPPDAKRRKADAPLETSSPIKGD